MTDLISTKNIDPVKLSLFLKNLSLAKKKIRDRKKAKLELSKQMKKIKKIPLPKKKKTIITGELEVLEKKINEVIEKEKKIVTTQQQESFFSKELERRINALEEKINQDLNYRLERKKKRKELEEKIKSKVKTRTEKIESIKKKIEKLESAYNNLKRDKKYDKEYLDRIKKRIDFLKQKIRL